MNINPPITKNTFMTTLLLGLSINAILRRKNLNIKNNGTAIINADKIVEKMIIA